MKLENAMLSGGSSSQKTYTIPLNKVTTVSNSILQNVDSWLEMEGCRNW